MDENIPDDKITFERYFKLGVFGLAMIFLILSAFQLYISIERIIYTWFEHQYVPIVRSFVNLAVLVLSVYIIRLYFVNK
ncbi:hypothetical protein [Methanococcoides burtonii]|uniref:DUF8060 domain-containing protein n=1 Tax=Methanococcoides burtonii (strain DSM 6242 / NBRC 107633 / OCM 468 / ACE-M) TaxID=259564 RepID=Q12UY3_METBU|nr:hypothetical protein [Methanococcoides burtonii]ABE52743.1 Hypothetical protein Mbur_1860 [Methanococcoides burtonii DSM 6242]